MVKSMTGFGRYEALNERVKITVEMKAVNHRYLDLNIKLPKKLNLFESVIRNQIKERIERGKVDVYISMEDFSEEKVSLQFHEEIAAQYMSHFAAMAERFQIENDIKVSDLARFPDVFTMEQNEEDEEEILTLLTEAVNGAAERFVETRVKEGENLKKDLISKLANMRSYVDQIESYAPGLVEAYRQKLEAKVKELLEPSGIDENRIAAEVTLYADKICTDEEMVRLRSHIKAMEDALNRGGSLGRKLDFLAQEMNREANTTLSKANNLEVSDIAISLKTEIEKIREQIQNLE